MTGYQQFIVIRHGESETNATNTFQAGNQYDSDPLTPLGAEDAGRLAQRLAVLPVDLVVSSSYLRARSTAARIAEATGAPHMIPVRQGSSWVDLARMTPRSATMRHCSGRSMSPASCRGYGSRTLARGRSSMPPWRSPTSQTAIIRMRKTCMTYGGGPRRSVGTWRRGRNSWLSWSPTAASSKCGLRT